MLRWITKDLQKPDQRTACQIWTGAGIVLILGLLAVMVFPQIDSAAGGNTPGLLSILGPAITISALTIFYLFWLAGSVLSFSSKTLLLAIVYNSLIIAIKFALSPIAIFVNQREFYFEGQFADFYNPQTVLLLIIMTVFILYLLVFTVLRRMYSSKLGIASKSSKKTRRLPSFANVLLFVALAVLTGGMVIVIPLILFFGSFAPLQQYLGFVFSGVTGLLIALCLVSATLFLSAAFDDVAKQTIARRNISMFVAFTWAVLALLIVYHLLWAVYLFVLVTLWPFKVTTVVPK